MHALLREVLACCRVFHIYPPTHGRIEAQVERVREQCHEVCAGAGPLELVVAGSYLRADGIDFEGDVAQTLSTQFKLRALRGVVLRSGISPREVRGLVAILAFDEGDARRAAFRPEKDRAATAHVEPLPWVGTGTWVHGSGGASGESLPGGGTADTPVVGTEGGGSGGAAEAAKGPAVPSLLRPVAEEAATPSPRSDERLLEELLADAKDAQSTDRVFEIDVPREEELLGEEELQAILEEGAGNLEERFAEHSSERLALRILFRLLVLAPDGDHYRTRRDTFLRTLSAPDRLFDDLVRVLGRLLQDGSLWRYEPAPEFVATVLDSVESLTTRVRLFSALPLRAEDAQATLRRWALRPDALASLARVLAARVAPEVADEAAGLLAREANRDRDAVETWFTRDRRAALHPRVLHTLVTDAPEAAAPICRRILQRSPPAVVRRVTHLLAAQGTDTALRMLTESLPKRRRGARADLIRAVARFPQPQVIPALCGVLQQNNDREMHAGEVEAAAAGLYAHELREGRELLWDIVEERTAIPYRRSLRALVEAVLEGHPA